MKNRPVRRPVLALWIATTFACGGGDGDQTTEAGTTGNETGSASTSTSTSSSGTATDTTSSSSGGETSSATASEESGSSSESSSGGDNCATRPTDETYRDCTDQDDRFARHCVSGSCFQDGTETMDDTWGVCGRGCLSDCNCWAAPASGTATSICRTDIFSSGNGWCVLDCSDGKTCPTGMECREPLFVCAFDDTTPTAPETGTDTDATSDGSATETTGAEGTAETGEGTATGETGATTGTEGGTAATETGSTG